MNVVGDLGAIGQSKSVATGGRAFAGKGSAVQVRVLVLKEIGCEFGDAIVALSIGNLGVKPEGWPAPGAIIQLHGRGDFFAHRKSDLAKQRWTPGTEISRRNQVTKGAIKGLVEVGPPEDRGLSDIESDILKDHPVIGV